MTPKNDPKMTTKWFKIALNCPRYSKPTVTVKNNLRAVPVDSFTLKTASDPKLENIGIPKPRTLS